MFAFCEDPSTLSNLPWMACYLTTGKQFLFYGSFLTVLALIFITAPVALLFGFGGAMAARSCIRLEMRRFQRASTMRRSSASVSAANSSRFSRRATL